MERGKTSSELSMSWWASPVGINIGFLLPMLVLIVYADHADFEGLTVRGVHYLTAIYIVLGTALLLITALGGWIGGQMKIERGGILEPNTVAHERAALAVGTVALFAYAIWFRDFLLNPLLLLKTFIGAYRPDRTNISLTVGVTSLVNVAPVFFSIYAYLRVVLRAKVSRAMHGMFIVLLGFTLFRVYAWSERLALVEQAVPLALAGAWRLHSLSKVPYRLAARLGPYIAIPFFVLYFGIAESVRSWTSPTYYHKLGFWQFVTGRLASYYYSSLNNGAGVLATSTWPSYHFENTLGWLHRAPLIGPLFSAAVNLDYLELERFLSTYGDPEFNNPSGLYAIVYDVGLPLGFAYFGIAGFLGGVLLRAYEAKRATGMLLYPMFFLFYLEIFRYSYFGSSRAFTWMLGIALAVAVARSVSQRTDASLRAQLMR